MPLLPLLLALQTSDAPPPAPPCRAGQLRLSVDGKDGDFNGMSHSGTELSIRNTGPDCTLPGLPRVEMLDARGRVLAAVRQVPPGMHPGPVVLPVRIGGGHRAASDLRWVSGPVFPTNRRLRAAAVRVSFAGVVLRTALRADLYAPAGRPATFEQPPMRAMEGLAAG